MTIGLTVILAEFLRWLELLRLAPTRTLRWVPGLRRHADGIELLLPSPSEREPSPEDPEVRVFRLAPGLEGIGHQHWRLYPPAAPIARPRLELALTAERRYSAAWLTGDEVLPLDELSLVGPMLERWAPARLAAPVSGDVPASGRFSRYAGSLRGAVALTRLQALRVALVGAPSDALFAEIARGVVRAGVSEVCAVGLGPAETRRQERTASLNAELRQLGPGCALKSLIESRDGLDAWRAMSAADVIIAVSVDDDALRLATSIAVAYHRLLLIVRVEGAGTGSVALFLPGSGCPECPGHAAPAPSARANVSDTLLATALAARAQVLLERLVTGDITGPRRADVTLTRDGRLSAEDQDLESSERCALCTNTQGLGDAVLLDPGRV